MRGRGRRRSNADAGAAGGAEQHRQTGVPTRPAAAQIIHHDHRTSAAFLNSKTDLARSCSGSWRPTSRLSLRCRRRPAVSWCCGRRLGEGARVIIDHSRLSILDCHLLSPT